MSLNKITCVNLQINEKANLTKNVLDLSLPPKKPILEDLTGTILKRWISTCGICRFYTRGDVKQSRFGITIKAGVYEDFYGL